ncbi:HMP-PP phosphatase [Streptococcus parauberis]|nr:HMP-PP phosphatase [Streptococcus parauberis]
MGKDNQGSLKKQIIMNETPYLVFDLDGTLVFDGIRIADGLNEILQLLNSRFNIIFASARPIRDMLPLLNDFPDNDLIGGNGSMYRQDGQIILMESIPVKAVAAIRVIMDREDLDYIFDYDWDYTARIRNSQNHILQKLDSGRLAKAQPISNSKVSKIILFDVSSERLAHFSDIKGISYVYHQLEKELVITAKGNDKYAALSRLIGAQAYLAFGNDHNDIEMLRQATYGFAIGKELVPGANQFVLTVDHLQKLLNQFEKENAK